ncbi:MAG: ComF family protein [Ignavibacteria bacterium]
MKNLLRNEYLTHFTDSVLEALAPIHCEICEIHIKGTTRIHRICDACLYMFEIAPKDDVLLNTLYTHSVTDTFMFSVRSAFTFHHEAPIQRAIYAIKYGFAQQMAFDFGAYMGLHVPDIEIDALLPVPLHTARLRERGYNQSQSIADGISSQTKIPVIQALQRTTYTITQTKFTSMERNKNVHGIFRVHNNQNIRGKRLMLIDDVMTTGSTLEACAETLLESGALSVSAYTIATAVSRKGIQ